MSQWRRWAGLGIGLTLASAAPGCFLPELIVDDGGANSGGGSSTDSGGSSSGGVATDAGTGGTSASGSAPGNTGGSPGGGSGGADTGGSATGGDGPGGGSGGGSGGAAPIMGYYESNSWHGFVSTFAAYGSVTPGDFSDTVAPPYCVSGSLTEDASSRGTAGWSWNINQPSTCTDTDCVPQISTQTPVGDGLVLRLSNEGGSPLRVQIQGPDGAQDPNQRWCSEPVLDDDGVIFIPWSDFNTECWQGGDGVAYAGSELAQVAVTVPGPGPGQGTRSFDYCVEIVGESDAPVIACELYGIPGLGSFNLAGSAATHVVRNAWPYVVQGDLWGTGTGQVIAGTGTFFEVTTGATGQAGTYPAVFVGEVGNQSSESYWLPFGTFDSAVVPTYMRWSGDLGAGGVALLEMRFSTPEENPSQLVQIWLAANGRTPGGNQYGEFVAEGVTWSAYADVVDGVIAAVFVAPSPVTTFDGDMRPFAVNAFTAPGPLDAAHDISAFLGGFQITSGGGVGLKLEDFCTTWGGL